MLEVKRAGALASLDELSVPLPLSGAHLAGKAIDINLSQFTGNFRCSGQLMERGRKSRRRERERRGEGQREGAAAATWSEIAYRPTPL